MVKEWINLVDYPQAPAMDQNEIESFLDKALFARLGTINEDGTAHITPIFFRAESGQILMATQEPSRKIRNIKRDRRVTILIDTTDIPFKGVLVYGTAELDYEDVITKRVRIFERTRTREEGEAYARKLSEAWPCVIIRVTPERFVSFDYEID